jgi:hypothetical protein
MRGLPASASILPSLGAATDQKLLSASTVAGGATVPKSTPMMFNAAH